MVAQTIAAVDIATDIASVEAFEVMGNCPQHMPAVAIIGTVAEVERALEALKGGVNCNEARQSDRTSCFDQER